MDNKADYVTLISILVTLASLFFNAFQYKKAQQQAKSDQALRLALHSPELLFRWNSNYAYIFLAAAKNIPVTEKLFGKFSLINQSSGVIKNVRITIYAGYDKSIVMFPYSTAVKATRIGQSDKAEINKNETIEIDVVGNLIDSGFNLLNPTKLNGSLNIQNDSSNWNQLSIEQREFGLKLSQEEGVVWDTEKHDAYGVYLRAYVEYSTKSQTYRSVLPGAIGYISPKIASEGGAIASTFSKAKTSIVTMPDQSKVAIGHPQIVDDYYAEVIDGRFPNNMHALSVRASGKVADFTTWFILTVLPANNRSNKRGR